MIDLRRLRALLPTLVVAATLLPCAVRPAGAVEPTDPAAVKANAPEARYVVVLQTGERLASREEPVVAFGRVVYTDAEGLRRALAADLVDLDATREANVGVAPAPVARRPAPAAQPPQGASGAPGGGSGRPVPSDIEAVDSEGETVRLSDLRGQVVLVDFWASWCGPCVREMPHVKAARDELADQGFEVIGVSLDRNREAFESFVEKRDLDWPHSFDGGGWKNAVAKAWGVRAIPRAMLIGRDGTIVRDRLRGEAIVEAAREALKAPVPADVVRATGGSEPARSASAPDDGKTPSR